MIQKTRQLLSLSNKFIIDIIYLIFNNKAKQTHLDMGRIRVITKLVQFEDGYQGANKIEPLNFLNHS